MPSSDLEGSALRLATPFIIFDERIQFYRLSLRVLLQMTHTSYGPRHSIRQYMLTVTVNDYYIVDRPARVLTSPTQNLFVEVHEGLVRY